MAKRRKGVTPKVKTISAFVKEIKADDEIKVLALASTKLPKIDRGILNHNWVVRKYNVTVGQAMQMVKIANS